jgi:arylsulfatase
MTRPNVVLICVDEWRGDVDGCSLAQFLRGSSVSVREWLHGEHLHFGQSVQWVTDGRVK